jgi:hypothetical protein
MASAGASLAATTRTHLPDMAAAHRLEPLLHATHWGNAALRERLRDRWRDAPRTPGITARAQRSDAEATAALLQALRAASAERGNLA